MDTVQRYLGHGADHSGDWHGLLLYSAAQQDLPDSLVELPIEQFCAHCDIPVGAGITSMKIKKQLGKIKSRKKTTKTADTATPAAPKKKKTKKEKFLAGAKKVDSAAASTRGAVRDATMFRNVLDRLMSIEAFGRIPLVQEVSSWSTTQVQSTVGRVKAFVNEYRPKAIPDYWWNIAMEELDFRIDNLIVPMSGKDIGLMYTRFVEEVRLLVIEYEDAYDIDPGVKQITQDALEFAGIWGNVVETSISEIGPTVTTAFHTILKRLVRLLIPLIKNIAALIEGIIIRIVKLIPYTSWLGAILCYVFAALHIVANVIF